ncbi:uncharacterized protein BDR25DRAFT_223812 [Lindgomyces ingoldianus]|uniref:Uncharacterized protein n=1 Tax=Lindgomyces ingoldianus TaxID=673940 RepID=A0ACB6QXS3_9PLEO|nr:uncharacterized protein BDR25DRAFT_223812 [Lindgomyces ingoldianus]KAF2471368.1 hypothetical protein BDR25DRAFT_223812 [Lindgomyces ingoldianus]
MEAETDVVPSVETTIANNEDAAHPKPALTPPTSEDMDKRERLSSELSELESDDDDEEIEPDHYFEGGKVPVFKPTMDQFRSFKKFVDKIDKYGMKSGIVKIIPPKEWRDALPDLSEAVKTIKVKNPITQEFAGQHGIYTQANIEKQRSYNLPEWKSLTLESHHQPPAKRGERRRAAVEAPERTRSTRVQASTQPVNTDRTPTPRRGPGRPRRRPLKKETKDDDKADEEPVDVPPTPTSPGREEEKKTLTRKIKKEEQDTAAPAKPRGRQPRSTASRRVNNRTETTNWVDEEAFKDFNYHLENVEEYTVERCKELEENYWRTINYGQPMYGADMPGSLFDDRTTSWNVAKLENLLDVLGTKVPGVNTAYLYLGMWKATFAWHLEDVDLYSINYIHFGAPKQWYSISQEDARRFEAAMKSIWPREAKNCSQFLRHKTFLISPSQLEKQFNIKVNRLVHYEGEFVITYPYGYHSGYNIGYNCAESVNFANDAWLNYGRIAKKCECESDSVWVDVNEIERKLRGEPTPEYYEETDSEGEDDGADHLPSPPPSVKGKARGKGRKPANNKRKRGEEELAKPKKRIRIRLKVPGKEMPCILCPNDVEFDDLLPTDNGLKAHRLCGDYTPETYVSSSPSERVCNVGGIGRDRLELKCNYCRSKRGAVFQCSSKKCTRAFHATCAFAAGVQVDYGPMQTFGDEGVEYVYDGYDFRCRWHRPKKRHAKTVDGETLEKDKFIFRYAKSLQPKDVVQFQYLGTDQVYGGVVVENRPGEWTVLVDVLPDGDRVELEWKYLLALDPTESQRPKPSANAQPLPEHIKDNDSSLSITNRTDGVPAMGDSFLDPNSTLKWAEFNTAPEVARQLTRVDFSKENQLWYYLGKTSTEARPQYTDDPTNPKHNLKANFLDTVKPASMPMGPIERRSYPASFPIKPSPAPTPRTPVQPYIRPAEKPYQYKPRVETATYKSPVYNYSPDSRKNPNSPVAHQPNVVYDHRATAPQYGYPSSTNGCHRPSQSYNNHYAQAPSSSSSWEQPSTAGPLLNGIDQYVRTSQPLPPYPYHQTATPSRSAQLPLFPYNHPPNLRPAYSSPAQHTSVSQSPASPRSAAPISGMLSSTAGTAKSPMYANAPSSSSSSSSSFTAQSPQSQADYLAYITKYPYLKNAFLRRAKTYVSPYSPDGGFTPEWTPKPVNGNTNTATSGPQSSHRPTQGLRLSFSSEIPSLPTPRPMPQFQTPDAFQRDVARAPPQSIGLTKWEQMVKQLASTGSQTPSTTTISASPLLQAPQLPRPPNMPHELSTGNTPMPKQSSLAAAPTIESKSAPPMPSEPQRPIPSPLSDATNSPKRPEYSPISDDGTGPVPRPALPSLPQIHSAETWRYS